MAKKRIELNILRIKHRLTQQQLADKMGVSISTYNLIEAGKREGSNEFWLKLQKEFNLTGGQVWNIKNPQIKD